MQHVAKNTDWLHMKFSWEKNSGARWSQGIIEG